MRRVGLWALLAVAISMLPLRASDVSSAPANSGESLVVLALVNGEEVTGEDLTRSLEVWIASASVRSAPPEIDLHRLLQKAVDDTLIAQEAKRLGMDQEPPIPERVERYRQNVAAARFEKEKLTNPSEPSDEQIEKLFQDQYRRATFHVATTATHEEAEVLLADLEGGASISDLAAERSIDPYRMRGGLVDNVPNIQLQRPIADVVFELSPGQIAGPIQTDLGWTVVRVQSLEAADREQFSEKETKLRSLARQNNEQILRASLARELRLRHPVTMDQDIVDSMRPTTDAAGRLTVDYPEPAAPVARIEGGGAVTAEEYGEALRERWKRVKNTEAAEAAAPIILEDLIDKELLMAGAVAQGYGELPKTKRAVHFRESQLLVSKYLNEVLGPTIEISEEEQRTYYEEHKQNYHKPPKMRLGQITVPTREEADKVADLLAGDAELGWLAKQYSTDQYKETGGDRGWYFVRPEMPDFNQDLLEGQPGDVIGPFDESDSWIVFKILAREDQGTYTYDEISGNVKNAAYSEKVRASIKSLIDSLRDLSEIEVHEDKLQFIQVLPSDPGDHAGRNESVHGH